MISSSQLSRQEVTAIFTRSIQRYFQETELEAPTIKTPYLANEEESILEFTAVIGISGDQKGCFHYTSSEPMLRAIAQVFGETDPTPELLCDMAGEIANTIAGNARMDLGSGFMISVPVVLEGQPRHLRLPKGIASIVIPITWREWTSQLIVSLENLENL